MSQEHLIINGKMYPMWEQFIFDKESWIGGILRDYGGGYMGSGYYEGIITDITLKPNGKESAFFSVESREFGCGFSVKSGGITAPVKGHKGDLHLDCCGHSWTIEKPKEEVKNDD